MRFKVELHRDVGWFIRHYCSSDETREFYGWLEHLRDDPVTDTHAIVDRELAPYAMRFFRFGRNIGIFRLDAVQEEVLVRQCRRFRGERTPARHDRGPP